MEPGLFVGARLLAISLTAKSIASKLAPTGAVFWPVSRPLKNVGEAGKTRQKRPKKRSLRIVNEHFEAAFNAVLPTQVVFQQPVSHCNNQLGHSQKQKPETFCG